jgi:hypothetical protein
MSNPSLTLFRKLGRVGFVLSLVLGSVRQASCSGTESHLGNGGATGAGGGATAGGGTAIGGSVSLGGRSSGAGGSWSSACVGRPSSCVPLCQAGICECYCPTTGGAGSDTGGGTATGGNANTGGGSAASGVCGSNCDPGASGATCGTNGIPLTCNWTLSVNFASIMLANGCSDMGTDLPRYCCPIAILSHCN